MKEPASETYSAFTGKEIFFEVGNKPILFSHNQGTEHLFGNSICRRNIIEYVYLMCRIRPPNPSINLHFFTRKFKSACVAPPYPDRGRRGHRGGVPLDMKTENQFAYETGTKSVSGFVIRIYVDLDWFG